jgi:NADPH:quinone reductase-like Zn-dependent oxidoreductase
MKSWSLVIDRSDLSSTTLVEAASARPTAGQALLRVDRVGLTTNNLTYCALGDALGYWGYFPTQIPGMAHIPLWGYAEVVATETDSLKRDDRVFGYLPSASHLLVTPSMLGIDRFRDGAPHRAELMPIYNEYTVVSGAPRSPERENLTALYRPLFMTSFAFETFAAANEWFGARRLLISSASSKTGYGIASLAHSRGAIEIVGITSQANVAFSQQLGCYDTVITYDDVEVLSKVPTLYADVAGDTGLRRRLHHHLADNLTHDAVLGISHISSPTSLHTGQLEGPAHARHAAGNRAPVSHCVGRLPKTAARQPGRRHRRRSKSLAGPLDPTPRRRSQPTTGCCYHLPTQRRRVTAVSTAGSETTTAVGPASGARRRD